MAPPVKFYFISQYFVKMGLQNYDLNLLSEIFYHLKKKTHTYWMSGSGKHARQDLNSHIYILYYFIFMMKDLMYLIDQNI